VIPNDTLESGEVESFPLQPCNQALDL